MTQTPLVLWVLKAVDPDGVRVQRRWQKSSLLLVVSYSLPETTDSGHLHDHTRVRPPPATHNCEPTRLRGEGEEWVEHKREVGEDEPMDQLGGRYPRWRWRW